MTTHVEHLPPLAPADFHLITVRSAVSADAYEVTVRIKAGANPEHVADNIAYIGETVAARIEQHIGEQAGTRWNG